MTRVSSESTDVLRSCTVSVNNMICIAWMICIWSCSSRVRPQVARSQTRKSRMTSDTVSAVVRCDRVCAVIYR
jgi:hypothetical protein